MLTTRSSGPLSGMAIVLWCGRSCLHTRVEEVRGARDPYDDGTGRQSFYTMARWDVM
jgi:hypothetical protein